MDITRFKATLSTLALFGTLVATEIGAQIPIDGTPSCPTCTIQIAPVVTLGKPGDPDEPGTFPPALDSRGRFFVANKNRTSVITYDGTGRYIASFGYLSDMPQGHGSKSQIIAGRGDTLFVLGYDWHYVYAPDTTLVRHGIKPANASGPAILLPSSQLVTVAAERMPQEYQARFHVFDASGLKTSFLASGAGESSSCHQCTMRSLFPDRSGLAFWSLRRNRYEIERWTVDGVRLESFVIQNSRWFKPWTEHFPGDESTSITSLTHIDVDAEGRIWTYGIIRRGSAPPPPDRGGLIAPGGRIISILTFAEAIKEAATHSVSVIEVLDLESRRVVASYQFPGVMVAMGGGLYYQARLDSLDRISLEIGRLSLVNR